MKNTPQLFQRVMTLLMLAYVLPGYAEGQRIRYRGAYTFAHEVNTFCPSINSQCYWLNPATSEQIRQQLKQLSATHTDRPYQSVCVVLSGRIDRETKSDGFAADYNGLIEVDKIFGLCSQVNIVNQGDLQHHRWVLENIKGVNIALAETGNQAFDLDFGEQMFVVLNTGCHKISGQAKLREQYFSISMTQSIQQSCTKYQQKIEQSINTVLGKESVISIDGRHLRLKNGNTELQYLLKDWVH